MSSLGSSRFGGSTVGNRSRSIKGGSRVGKNSTNNKSTSKSKKSSKKNTYEPQIVVGSYNVTPKPLLTVTKENAEGNDESQFTDDFESLQNPAISIFPGLDDLSGSDNEFETRDRPSVDGHERDELKSDTPAPAAAPAPVPSPAVRKAASTVAPEPKYPWTEAELAEQITIRMEETSTTVFLTIPSQLVWVDDNKQVDQVKKRNERYEASIARHKDPDLFIDGVVQTFNNPTRNKSIATCGPATYDSGVQTTAWDIYDEYAALRDHESGAAAADSNATDAQSVVRAGPAEKGPDSPRKMKQEPAAFPVPEARPTTTTHSSKKFDSSTATMVNSLPSMLASHHSYTAGPAPAADGGVMQAAVLTGPQLAATLAQERVLRSPELLRALEIAEQAVVQNQLHAMHLLFRNHPEAVVPSERRADAFVDDRPEGAGAHLGMKSPLKPASDQHAPGGDSEAPPAALAAAEVASDAPRLIPLWTYECPLTTASPERASSPLSVTAILWNSANADLLAAGYGCVDFDRHVPGIILFWSLKNPHYPQRVIKTKQSVTSLDFSTDHPHLLAAGFYDGSVAIYDLRDAGDKPALEALHSTGKHSDPVWGLKWASYEARSAEQRLTSVSSDGSVREWSLKKGLVPSKIMELKRFPNRADTLAKGHVEGVSRDGSGLCIDFICSQQTPVRRSVSGDEEKANVDGVANAADGASAIYFAGTEDGLIQKCSVSYKDGPLEQFHGHTGPVYKIRCSPFHSDAFLSCSADWTCALWSQNTAHFGNSPVLTFQSVNGHDYITDIAWSPTNSTVFGLVSRDGRIELWDLEFSPLDPLMCLKRPDKKLCSLLFSESAPVLLAGATDGSVDVFQIHGVDLGLGPNAASNPKWQFHNQRSRLDEAMKKHNDLQKAQRSMANAAVTHAPHKSPEAATAMFGKTNSSQQLEKPSELDGIDE